MEQLEDGSTWDSFEHQGVVESGDHIVPGGAGASGERRKRSFDFEEADAPQNKRAFLQNQQYKKASPVFENEDQAAPEQDSADEVFEDIDADSLSPLRLQKGTAPLAPEDAELGSLVGEEDGKLQDGVAREPKAGSLVDELEKYMKQGDPDPIYEYALELDRAPSGQVCTEQKRFWLEDAGVGVDKLWDRAPPVGKDGSGNVPVSSSMGSWGQSQARVNPQHMVRSGKAQGMQRGNWDGVPLSDKGLQGQAGLSSSYYPWEETEASTVLEGPESNFWSPFAQPGSPSTAYEGGSVGPEGGEGFLNLPDSERRDREQRRGELAGRLKATQNELNKIALEIWAEEQRPGPEPGRMGVLPEEQGPPSTSGRDNSTVYNSSSNTQQQPQKPRPRTSKKPSKQPDDYYAPIALSPISPTPLPTFFEHRVTPPPAPPAAYGWTPEAYPIQAQLGTWQPSPFQFQQQHLVFPHQHSHPASRQQYPPAQQSPPPQQQFPPSQLMFVPRAPQLTTPSRMGMYPPSMFMPQRGPGPPAQQWGGQGRQSVPPQGGMRVRSEMPARRVRGQGEEAKKAESAVTNLEVPVDDKSTEGVVLRHLKGTMEKLDLSTRLNIRDSLYRLSHSASLRAAASQKASGVGSPVPSEQALESLQFPPPTELTNVVDRSVAQLLYHKHPTVEAAGGYNIGLPQQQALKPPSTPRVQGGVQHGGKQQAGMVTGSQATGKGGMM